MKVVLLGDIHFGKYSSTQELSIPGEKNQDVTTGAVPLIESFVSKIKDENADYLFVAGDLTSTGSPIEYSRCLNEIYKIASSASIDKRNVVIGVGNHDIDRKIAKLAEADHEIDPSYPLIESKLLYHRLAAKHGELFVTEQIFDEKGPAPFSGVIVKDDSIITVLNSAWGYSADAPIKHGKLESEQLDWYKAVVDKYKSDTRWKIVLMHHHPFNYAYPTVGRDISLLEEGAELLEISGNAGIDLVCHGHRHHPKASNELHATWISPITFICAGSFSVNAAHRGLGRIPNIYHVLELNNDNGCKVITMHSYQYSISTGWDPIKSNCPETPIDPIMVFERPYHIIARQSILKSLIQSLSGTPFKEMPAWNDLPMELKTLKYETLNETIKHVANVEYKVIGEYPKEVALLRRS